MPSDLSPLGRMTDFEGLTERGFEYDYDSIAPGFLPSKQADDFPKYHLGYLIPLPDSPPVCTGGYRGRGIRQHRYVGRGTSRIIVGAGDEPMPQAGGSGEAAEPTLEELLTQAQTQLAQMQDMETQLRAELETAQRRNDERGRQPRPGPWADMYSVPRPPRWTGPPGMGPTGDWDANAAMLGVKPILMKPPTLFKGDHDDIERFLGDCRMYFEAFRMFYLGLPSLMIVFTTSHLEGNAQNWWVHLQEDYWYVLCYDSSIEDRMAGPQY